MIIRYESADGLAVEEDIGSHHDSYGQVLYRAVRYDNEEYDFERPETWKEGRRMYVFSTVLEYTPDMRWKKLLYKEMRG